MEPYSCCSRTAKKSPQVGTLHYGCNRDNFPEIKNYLEKSIARLNGPSPEIILQLDEEEISIHATVLAALSSSWRQYLHRNKQDTQIIHRFGLDLPGELKFLPTLKTLLYSGEAVLSVISVDDVMTLVRALNLDFKEFILTDRSNEEQVLLWDGHHDQLLKGLQQMCTKQMCTDLSIFVDGHLIKVHRLVLSAYSSVLRNVFQENSRIRLMHWPGVSVKSAQSLIAFMYFGKASVDKTLIPEFRKLCLSLEVTSLATLTEGLDSKTSEVVAEESKKVLNHIASIKPEIGNILKRLQQLYDVVGKTDLTFLVEKKRIASHKALLGVACPMVHAMLVEELTDEHTVILVSDADYVSIRCLLSLIYNGSCSMSEIQKEVLYSYLDENIFSVQCNQEDVEPSEKAKINNSKRNISFLRGGKMATNKTKGSPKKDSDNRKFNVGQAVFKPIVDDANDDNEDNVYDQEYDFMADRGTEDDVGSEAITTPHNSVQQNEDKAEVEASRSKRRRKNKYNSDEWVTDFSPPRLNIENKHKALNRCDMCNKTFMKKSQYKKHMITHRKSSLTWKNKSFRVVKEVCEECGESVSIKDMWTHMKMHKEDYQCAFCEKRFPQKSLLNEHIKSKHAHEESEDSDTQNTDDRVQLTNRLEKCRNCKATFFTNKELRTHWRMQHCEVEPYEREGCSSSFLQQRSEIHKDKEQTSSKLFKEQDEFKKERQCHQKQPQNTEGNKQNIPETNTADWTCDQCPFRCSDYGTLLKHVDEFHSTNYEEKAQVGPYHCEDCSTNFMNLEDLKHHRETEHPCSRETVYTCSGCDKVFQKLGVMRKHERICRQRHTKTTEVNIQKSPNANAANWSCNQCTYQCSDYGNLLQHVDELHSVGSIKVVQKEQSDNEIEATVNEPSLESEAVDFVEFTIDNSNNSYACPECGKVFNNLESFSAHADKEGHGGLVGSCWICGICKSAFFEESQLNEHLASHNPLPDYYVPSDTQKQLISIYGHNEHSNETDGESDSSFNARDSSFNAREYTKMQENILNKSTKSKNISHHKVEADSSVLDREISGGYELAGRSDSASDFEMNVVTSSMSNEKTSSKQTASPIFNM